MYGQLPCDRPWAEVYVRSFLLYLHINETIVNRHSLLFLIIMMMVERRKCGTRPPGHHHDSTHFVRSHASHDTSCIASSTGTTELSSGEPCILMTTAGPGLSRWGQIHTGVGRLSGHLYVSNLLRPAQVTSRISSGIALAYALRLASVRYSPRRLSVVFRVLMISVKTSSIARLIVT
jgi:hypothetical protein